MKETHSPSQEPPAIHRQNFEENSLVRYLIPPFLFLLSLLLAMLFDPHYRYLLDPVLQWMRSPQETTKVVVALIQFLVAGTFAVVAFGFLLSSVSMYFLRWLSPDYEEKVSPSALGSIRDRVRMAGAGGQMTFIIPSHDLVVVRLGHFKGAAAGDEGLKNALSLLMEAVPESR